jgi:hypothetical protein
MRALLGAVRAGSPGARHLLLSSAIPALCHLLPGRAAARVPAEPGHAAAFVCVVFEFFRKIHVLAPQE